METKASGDHSAKLTLHAQNAVLRLVMRKEDEDYFLNPPPGSAAERAVEFGVDLTLTLQNLRLTSEERIRKLDKHLADKARLEATLRSMGQRKDLLMLLELEPIQEYHQ